MSRPTAKTSAIRAKSLLDANERLGLVYDARAQVEGARAILFKNVDKLDEETWSACRLLDRALVLLAEVAEPEVVDHG